MNSAQSVSSSSIETEEECRLTSKRKTSRPTRVQVQATRGTRGSRRLDHGRLLLPPLDRLARSRQCPQLFQSDLALPLTQTVTETSPDRDGLAEKERRASERSRGGSRSRRIERSRSRSWSWSW